MTLALVGAALSSSQGQSEKLTPQEIYTKCKDAIVTIETDKGTGTGFFYLENDLVATCLHVISDASKIEVKDSAGHSWSVESVYFDKKSDSALLRVKGDPIRPLRSADPNAASVGDGLAIIGNPLGVLDQTLTTGVLSAKRAVNGIALFQVSAAVSPGSSGSPVLATDGSVLGFVSFTFAEGQALNMAVGCNTLVSLAKKDSVPVSLFLSTPTATQPSDGSAGATFSKIHNQNREATELGVIAINKVLTALQNWRIQFCRACDTPKLTRVISGSLKRNAEAFVTSIVGSEIVGFEDYLDAHGLWKDEVQRKAFLSSKDRIADLSSEVYDAQLDVLNAATEDELRRAWSVAFEFDARLSDLLFGIIRSLKEQSWFEDSRFVSLFNTGAAITRISFERTYFIPDAMFPERAQIGYVFGNPFHSADVITSVRFRGDKEKAAIKNWTDFWAFYEALPEGKNDLVFEFTRDGKMRELGAITVKKLGLPSTPKG